MRMITCLYMQRTLSDLNLSEIGFLLAKSKRKSTRIRITIRVAVGVRFL